MSPRLNLTQPNEGLQAMRVVGAWLAKTADLRLLALVKLRASQINGCAFCPHMHSAEALKAGERAERLILLDAWRQSKLYSGRERAALTWTEGLTRVAETHAPDHVFEEVRRHFSEDELVTLSIAVALINAFNRIAIGARAEHPAGMQRAACSGLHEVEPWQMAATQRMPRPVRSLLPAMHPAAISSTTVAI